MAVSGAGPAKIFVSYRRADAGWPARWLTDRLAEQFGAGVVFQDVDSILPGDDFAAAIEAAVGSCSVLLALIGSRWLAVEAGRGRRLDDLQDWVRLEIETAIRRGIRVIPVLLDGARMPMAEELPQSLRELARRQAVTLSPASYDIRRLVSTLEVALSAPAAEQWSSALTWTEAKAAADPERAGAIARATRPSGSRAIRDAGRHTGDMTSRAERESAMVLDRAQAHAAKIEGDGRERAEGIKRDSVERHRQAIVFLSVYSIGTDAASRVLPLAEQIADRVTAYGRREATNTIAEAQAWAKHLERDAQDRQRQAQISAAAQNDETDTAQRVLSLSRQTADLAIADTRREATQMVAKAQERAQILDRDVLERHRQALASIAAPGSEADVAKRVLSLGQETAEQAIADARREAARIVADAQARALSLVARPRR